MAASASRRGASELRRLLIQDFPFIIWISVFTAITNILMMTGPLFMMQVYDRVLGSRSQETLVTLFSIVTVLFILMGLLDSIRTKVMQRIGARFQQRAERRVFEAALADSNSTGNEQDARIAMRDLDILQRMLGSPVLIAALDLPWSPLFLFAIYLFHPVLAAVAAIGGAVLIASVILNQLVTSKAAERANSSIRGAENMSDMFLRSGDLVGSLGMRDVSFARWQAARAKATAATLESTDRNTSFLSFSKTFRLFLQSAMLAAGAWLVLRQELSPGAMIAASILMGRALSPVEQVIGQWAMVQRAIEAWARISSLMVRRPATTRKLSLPRPEAHLRVRNLSVVPPGQRIPTLKNVSFDLKPGTALGIIGPSGAGKSTLARTIMGVWPSTSGTIQLGSARLNQYDPDSLGQLIGYLPQQVTLFSGTIAENIARFDPEATPEKIVSAARAAAAHEMITNLPDGYNTVVDSEGGHLSGGQVQRVGLARALYTDPVLLVLDEPNSNLDNDGSRALNKAVQQLKTKGGAVIIMAHRPSAIAECEQLVFVENGVVRAAGPRDAVLAAVTRNAKKLLETGEVTGTA